MAFVSRRAMELHLQRQENCSTSTLVIEMANILTCYQVVDIYKGKTPLILHMGSYPCLYWAPTSMAWFANQRDASDPSNAYGTVVGIEFNGKSTLTAWSTGLDGIGHIQVAIDFLNHTISKQPFEWPGFFIGIFQGDWDEAAYRTQRFTEECFSVEIPDANYPYAQYDSWSYGTNINETSQMEALDVAIRLGLEVFVLDLGWATKIGQWVTI